MACKLGDIAKIDRDLRLQGVTVVMICFLMICPIPFVTVYDTAPMCVQHINMSFLLSEDFGRYTGTVAAVGPYTQVGSW